ncbi:MAG: hypothetical protein WBX01_02160 [Nitrososphaeraceae archaeon]
MPIQKEKDSLYHKTLIPYTIPLGTLFTKKEIKLAKKSPSFSMEYDLKYLGGAGNIFLPDDIEYITNDKYTLSDSNEYFTTYLGCDMAFGSSNFAITIVQLQDKINVLYSQEFERPEYETMVSLIHQLIQKYPCCI